MQEDTEEIEWFQYSCDAIGIEKSEFIPYIHFYCAEQCMMSTAKERANKTKG